MFTSDGRTVGTICSLGRPAISGPADAQNTSVKTEPVRRRYRDEREDHSMNARALLRTRRSVQQRSTATTALSNTFGFIHMRPGQRKQSYKRLLRGVPDDAAGVIK